MIYEKLKQTKTITNNWSDVFSCGFNVSHYYWRCCSCVLK